VGWGSGALGGQGGVIRAGWGERGALGVALGPCKVRSVDYRAVPWSPRITIWAMVEPLDDMPEGTVGFRINGDVDREDYIDVLVPALKSAVDSSRGLRTLYLIEDLDEIEGAALWEDTKLGYDLVLRHHGAWRRSAIVTDIEWMARASRMFLWLFPGEARLFRVGDLEQAKAWIAGE
jgi:hypothetical protein